MVAILVYLLVLALFLWILNLILGLLMAQLSLPPQVRLIVLGIVGLIFLIVILQRVGVLGGAGPLW